MATASPADSQEAFARMILEAHGEAIRRYLRRRGVLPGDLEDVLQDVVRTASKVRETYDPARHQRAWLIGIAANVLVHYRRGSAHRLRLMPGDEVAVIVDARPGPEELMIQRERLAMLDQMVDSMPESHRGVFIQYKLEEIPMPAVARAAGISLDTAWMYCKAGEEHCRAWFRRWRAAERAKGRDGDPVVVVPLFPLFDAMESVRRDSARSRFAGLAGRVFMRAAVVLLALGCMSPASRDVLPLEPVVRGHSIALSAGVPSEPGSDSVPTSPPAALPSTRSPEATPTRAPRVSGATADHEDDDVEVMVLQAEVEHHAGNDAEAIRWLMDHSEHSSGKSEEKRNKLLHEIAGQ